MSRLWNIVIFLGPIAFANPPAKYTVPSISMEMIWCPPGTFSMGSPTTEKGRRSSVYVRGGDETQHQVTLTNGFFLGKFELSQAQYNTVMKFNPSYYTDNGKPVESVSWSTAISFCEQITQLEQSENRLPKGWAFTLPTEAEWEYACRAGTTSPYFWGETITTSQANYASNGLDQTVAIGSYSANPWGFYDMHGNVWEWVYDYYSPFESGSVTDPQGPEIGNSRVNRGGSYVNDALELRSAYREADWEGSIYDDVGFRVAFKPVSVDAAIWFQDESDTDSEKINNAPIFSSAGSDLGSGWRSLDWFGFYFTHSSGWSYHLNHGWIFPVSNSFDSVWLYSPTHGWLWTTQSTYPWTWFHTGQAWKYYLTAKSSWYDPNNSPTIDGDDQKNDTSSEKDSADDDGTGTVNSKTMQISIYSDLFDYNEIIDLKTMFPSNNIRNFSITDMGYSSNSMKAQAEMEWYTTWTNVVIEFTRPEGTATLYTAVDLNKNGIPDFFDWPESYIISIDGDVKVSWNAFNYFGNSIPMGTATYGLENSNLKRNSGAVDSTITRSISLKSTTLDSFYKSYLPDGRIDTFTPKPVKASGGITLDLTQGNYTSEVTVSGDGVKTTTKLKGGGTASIEGDKLSLSNVPLPSMGNAELGKIHSFMADESVLENVILTKHDEVYSGYVTKNQVHYWIEVSTSEENSQTQDSNNNSSGSNSTSSFDPSNPPKTWTAASASDLEMIWVEPGTFTMGSPTTESGRSSNETQHQVTLTQGFYLGKYEVTQAQYEAVMTGNSDGLSATPSNYSNNPNRPVEKVSWNDIQVFLTRLNQGDSTNIPAGWAYVLPTEAQWEYACRAGTTTAYFWGNSITSTNANYNQNIGSTQDVGQYSPNAWGFFDMHGNVWEWTADWYAYSYYGSNAVTDPTGPASGSLRVFRGGSWHIDGSYLRSAWRYGSPPGNRSNSLGFRVGFQKVQ